MSVWKGFNTRDLEYLPKSRYQQNTLIWFLIILVVQVPLLNPFESAKMSKKRTIFSFNYSDAKSIKHSYSRELFMP